jgi:hypothetical protein
MDRGCRFPDHPQILSGIRRQAEPDGLVPCVRDAELDQRAVTIGALDEGEYEIGAEQPRFVDRKDALVEIVPEILAAASPPAHRAVTVVAVVAAMIAGNEERTAINILLAIEGEIGRKQLLMTLRGVAQFPADKLVPPVLLTNFPDKNKPTASSLHLHYT